MSINPDYAARALKAEERFLRELAGMREEWLGKSEDRFSSVETELAQIEKRRQVAA